MAFLVASPLLVPALLSASRSDYGLASGHDEHKADLLSFFVPSERQWVSQPFRSVIDLLDTEAIDGVEHSVYVGWAILILCLCYLGRIASRRGNAQLFVLITGVFSLLALGPFLSVNGYEEFGASGWQIPLPGAILAELPGFRGARAPSRVFIVAAIGLAVWAGYALRLLLQTNRILGLRSRVVGIGIVGITAVEFILPPGLAALPTPRWLEIIQADPAPGIVAHMPMRPEQFAFWQTQFDRRMMLADLGRIDPKVALYYWRHGGLRLLTYPGYVGRLPDKTEASYLVDLLQIRYIVVDRAVSLPERIRRAEPILVSSYGLELVHEDDVSALYRKTGPFGVYRELNFTAEYDFAELALLYGWSNRVIYKGEHLAWMTEPKAVIAAPPMYDGQYVLSLDLLVPTQEALTVAISIGQQDLGSYHLVPGSNHLEIRVPQGVLEASGPNLIRIAADRSIGLPHRTGLLTHPAPYGVPIEAISQGFFTKDQGHAGITLSNKRFVTDGAGVLAVHLDSTGRVVSEFFDSLTPDMGIDSLEAFIQSAPLSATVIVAARGSSDLDGGHISQALKHLGVAEDESYNLLNSLAVVGARDGRPPIVDMGAATADIVLGRTIPSREASIGLIGLKLVEGVSFPQLSDLRD